MKHFLFIFLFSSFLFSQEFFYGPDKLQTIDIYNINSNKTVFLVHGGAWKFGDKNSFNQNKTSFFNQNGFNVVLINYRLIPDVSIEEQLEDIKLAILKIKHNMKNQDFYLIGHSAGAHLISLLNFDPELNFIKGSISLDSAALNVVSIMEKRHLPFYDDAFGSSKDKWFSLSPFYQNPELQNSPMLLICSANRKESCPISYSFIYKMNKFNNKVISLNKSHSDISSDIGIDLIYSNQLLDFLNDI